MSPFTFAVSTTDSRSARPYIAVLVAVLSIACVQIARPASAAKNSWRGIIPLRSSAASVAQILGRAEEAPEGELAGPFKVEGGEVTFSYLTPSLARIYRAPGPMVGKVFTVYFKPDVSIAKDALRLGPGFKRCVEENDNYYYYLVSDAGVAYQLKRETDQVESIIYQPSRAEVRRLAVSVDCVF